MITEIITEESIGTYIKVLKNEEIFGILDGRITGIGARNEETGLPQGVLTAEIHMEYILVRRIYIRPEYSGGETADGLIRIITDLPDDLKAPILLYGTEDTIDKGLLSRYGFTEMQSRYSLIQGELENYKEIRTPMKTYETATLDKAPIDQVQAFILGSDYDRFIQIPDGYLDAARFSDGSLVCLDHGRVAGVILMEEPDDGIRITYMHAKNNMVLLHAMYVLKRVLMSEYPPKARLQFLMKDGIGREAISVLMNPGAEKKVSIFRYEDGV